MYNKISNGVQKQILLGDKCHHNKICVQNEKLSVDKGYACETVSLMYVTINRMCGKTV
jgi:hypothetical protein